MNSVYSMPTATGDAFDLADPRPEMVDHRAIAAHLSREPRWYGNLAFHYSVAQHTLVVAESIERPDWRIYALLHDAAEFVTRDLPTPFKLWLVDHGADVMALERRILACVWQRFGLAPPTKEIAEAIDLMDARAAATEYRDVVMGKLAGWAPDSAPLSRVLRFRMQFDVERDWLQCFDNYLGIALEAGLGRAA